MYYKIAKGTDLFTKLMAIQAQMKQCTIAAEQLAEEITGYTNVGSFIKQRSYSLAGGITGINFGDNKIPDGWRKVNNYPELWFPKASHKPNKPILKKIAELPVVTDKNIKELLQYGNYGGADAHGMFFSTIPSTILWREDVILIEVRDAIKDYKPVADMQEILAIEFAELCKEPVEAETH